MATPSFLSRFKSGDSIFNENDAGNEMFIIEQGKVQIFQMLDGQERVLAEFEQGDFFGESAVLESLPRRDSARAMTDCKVLQIDRSTFDLMIRQHPEIAMRILRKLSQRVRDAQTNSLESLQKAIVANRDADVVRKTFAGSHTPTPPPPPPPPPSVETAPAPQPEPAPKLSSTRTRKAEVREEPAEAPPAPRERTIAKVDRPPVREEPERAPVKPFAPMAHAPSSSSPGTLVDESGKVRFTLNPGPESSVGRFDSVTGIRPDVDLTDLDTSRSTSRRHATIVREDGHLYVLEEKATANGSFVNGKRIKTGVRSEFQDGDQLRFGAVKLNVKL